MYFLLGFIRRMRHLLPLPLLELPPLVTAGAEEDVVSGRPDWVGCAWVGGEHLDIEPRTGTDGKGCFDTSDREVPQTWIIIFLFSEFIFMKSRLESYLMVVFPVFVLTKCPTVLCQITSWTSFTCFATTVPTCLKERNISLLVKLINLRIFIIFYLHFDQQIAILVEICYPSLYRWNV